MKTILLTTAILSFCASSFSQTVFDEPTKWLKSKTESAKSNLSDRPVDTNRTIAGNWRDKVQVIVASNIINPKLNDRYAYNWIGDINVTIQNTGDISFLMSNGCRYIGKFTTFASDTTWSAEGQFENCSITTLNRRIIGRIIHKNGKVFLNLTQTGVTIDPQVKISIRTTMLSRY
jgi:hypothetical protein